MPEGMLPQDDDFFSSFQVVALFHCSFHITKGNIIDWFLKQDHIDLDGLEYSCLPSGLHLVEKDVIYISRDGYEGVCVYRRRQTEEEGLRGARFSAIGLLVEKSTRPRPWRHLKHLHALSSELDNCPDNRQILAHYYEDHKQSATNTEGPWVDWPTELSLHPDHPLHRLPLLINILGPSTVTVFKYVLARKRIMIYTHPATELSCLMAMMISQVCHQKREAASEPPVTILGMVGLTDLDRLALEASRGYGWIACRANDSFGAFDADADDYRHNRQAVFR
ncbi:uncharacterized protein EI90DRAFT_2991674 [Cantharellus anzutake]|uniref:uncharacterized protein n=1 Tax=Cantharellus anzutake TaxID=1750568 RepID=UPI001907089E|nr:uncharacterized protein EI90DRAFT_2991674 [Cantharellus anzutake]KAF8337377.1 hypothetical protein EI90DRAFT_2991674 [Cantharellus anzutake]